MHSTTSPLLPHLDTTRSCSIRHVSGLASLASLASSAPHDFRTAMRSDAVRCKPEEAAMTQAMTQAWNAGDRSDASGRAACCATTSPTLPLCGVLFPPLDKYATAAYAPTRANVAYPRAIPPVVGTSRNLHGGLVCGNSSRLRHSLFCLSDQTPEPRSERKCHVGFYPF